MSSAKQIREWIDMVEYTTMNIAGGISVPVSGAENKILTKVKQSNKLSKEELEENEIELARRMVSRGLLNRVNEGENTYYTLHVNNQFRRI